MDKKCKSCEYYEQFTGACCNADSEWVADFRNEDDSCPQWIEIKERESVDKDKENGRIIEYWGTYKCRLCGEKFYRKSTGDEDVAIKNMLIVTVGYEMPKYMGTPVTETTMHSCKDGSLGLADFMGFRKVVLYDKHN